jgi:uncharacterized protein YceK
MGRLIFATFAFLVTTAISGCGTMGNMCSCCVDGPHQIYGGVILDAKAASECGSQALKTNGLESLGHVAEAACYGAIDLPLSAIADTLMLPITIRWEIEGASEMGPKSAKDSDNH